MKKLLLAGTAMLAFAGAAQAADLPDVQEPVYAPIAPVYSFAGFYVGANVGYIDGQLDAEVTTTPATAATGFEFGGDDNGGIIGGVQAGYNAQFDQFVFGIEGDISAISFDVGDDDTLVDTATAANVFGLPASVNSEFDVDVDYLATLRARAGVTFDRFMVYGTGGFAFTSVDLDYSVPGATFTTESDDDIQVGYTVGGGVEGLVTENLTAKLEYLYVDFEDENLDFTVPATGVSQTIEADLDAHVIRAGVNYKFGGLGGF